MNLTDSYIEDFDRAAYTITVVESSQQTLKLLVKVTKTVQDRTLVIRFMKDNSIQDIYGFRLKQSDVRIKMQNQVVYSVLDKVVAKALETGMLSTGISNTMQTQVAMSLTASLTFCPAEKPPIINSAMGSINFWMYKSPTSDFEKEDDTMTLDERRLLAEAGAQKPSGVEAVFKSLQPTEYFLSNILSGFFIMNLVIIAILLLVKLVGYVRKKPVKIPALLDDLTRFDMVLAMNYFKFTMLAFLYL